MKNAKEKSPFRYKNNGWITTAVDLKKKGNISTYVGFI
jgi:hypothetical protein